MGEKKLAINCCVCDTRNIKEENYSHYESIWLNTDIMIVNEQSKAVLNRLPLSMNFDRMIENDSKAEIRVQSVNGSYEIAGNSAVSPHILLTVNGSLLIHPGTEDILEKYEGIIVNGNVRYPKSLEGSLEKMNVNGCVETYPDDCVVLHSEFTIDKYFPLRAKEGGRYYVKDLVIIKDTSVDTAKLAQKGVSFVTGKLLLPECKLKDCIPMFDESVEFIVVPDGMKLICGDIFFHEEFVRREGGSLFVFGDLEVDSHADMSVICNQTENLIVKGSVRLHAKQENAFRSLHAAFDHIEVIPDVPENEDQEDDADGADGIPDLIGKLLEDEDTQKINADHYIM